jgi:hypothetical protein
LSLILLKNFHATPPATLAPHSRRTPGRCAFGAVQVGQVLREKKTQNLVWDSYPEQTLLTTFKVGFLRKKQEIYHDVNDGTRRKTFTRFSVEIRCCRGG